MKLPGYLHEILCVVAALILTDCGVPGIPRPPSLNLPQPVSDLRALRKGDAVFLAWTVPGGTTDGGRLRKLGITRVCRSSNPASNDCTNPAGSVSPPQEPEATHGEKAPTTNPKLSASYTDHLPPALLSNNPSADLFYAVSVLNQNGRSAGLSNKVAIPAIAALPFPSDIDAMASAAGIVLTWTGDSHAAESPELRHFYRVYRREEGTKVDTVVGEMPFGATPSYSLVDRSFEWEKTYEYRVCIVDQVDVPGKPKTQLEGDDSPPVRVFAHDIFPPAVPSGLEAVFSGVRQQPFIDLIWVPDTDADLAGYNIYRREGSGAEQKINSELLKVPAFRDTNVLLRHSYFYSVSAVDIRGNESARSAEASETVP